MLGSACTTVTLMQLCKLVQVKINWGFRRVKAVFEDVGIGGNNRIGLFRQENASIPKLSDDFAQILDREG
jgi:hypothetical protein